MAACISITSISLELKECVYAVSFISQKSIVDSNRQITCSGPGFGETLQI